MAQEPCPAGCDGGTVHSTSFDDDDQPIDNEDTCQMCGGTGTVDI